MLVGIHTDPTRRFYTERYNRYRSVLDFNHITRTDLDINRETFWDEVRRLDAFVYPWGHTFREKQLAPAILPIVEKELGIRCYPNMQTWWCYDDKIREYYLLQQFGFPVVPTWIFWNREEALTWLDTRASFPLVFKLSVGAGSLNVLLVKKHIQAKRLVKRMFGTGIMVEHLGGLSSTLWKEFDLVRFARHLGGRVLRRVQGRETSPFEQFHRHYVMFQQFVPNNGFDTRITIIGNRAFGFRRFVRTNDFRASGSGRIDYNERNIDLRCVEIAFRISRKFGFQSMAYDFLSSENGQPLICEISYTFVDTILWHCTGYWNEGLEWYPGHCWPQYCVLADLLCLPDLRQPDMVP